MASRLLRLLIVLAVLGVVYVAYWAIRRPKGKDEESTPPWRDTRALAMGAQIGALGLIISVGDYLWANYRARSRAIGLDFVFDFLDDPSGISVADNPLSPNAAITEALKVGIKNTFLIIIIGIPVAIILGTLIGVARLSSNWLLAKLATVYVEFFRNIPPLLVIVFSWTIFLNAFPPDSRSWVPLNGWFVFNNLRFAGPSIIGTDNFGIYQALIVAALVVAAVVWYWRTKVFDTTGSPHHRVLWSFGTFAGIALIGFFALGGPFDMSKPEIVDRVYIGGVKMLMPYVAVTFGLVLYTASHISEIVRGSILSVNKGQVEAGNALALSGFQRYRLVVLPQAFRVAFPPLINQFLNFTKNSSLAIAIGFTEVTGIVTNLFGQSKPAPQLLIILMMVYLTFSLVLSALGNLANRKLQIVGR